MADRYPVPLHLAMSCIAEPMAHVTGPACWSCPRHAQNGGMNTWYTQLNRPPLTPPDAIFGPVWTVLYAMIILSWTLFVITTLQERRRGNTPLPYRIYAVMAGHAVCNLAWTPLFFGLRSPGLALIDILLLDASLIVLIAGFWPRNRPAALLLLPYLIWVLFATYLNLGFWWLNRAGL